MSAALKAGGFVDAEYVRYNCACQMRHDVLRRFAARGNRIPLRLNTCVAKVNWWLRTCAWFSYGCQDPSARPDSAAYPRRHGLFRRCAP